ncbi:HlyD family secretion protein [Nisaea sediminum]|uniref:HlyD family secretion protein n=1 Tax=Nisaea sediminum TaxID=2775867 RepID=UPI00186650E6|nr:HlyD family secretion protein [Nisaea sediminum]
MSSKFEGGLPEVRRSRKRRFILLLLLTLVLTGSGYKGYEWWTRGRFEISTDDAYVGADMSMLSAKISGYVTTVEVEENQAVKKGDVIARVDDGDYRLALQGAEDKIATQEATIARFDVETVSKEAEIEEAGAKVAAAKVELERAELEFVRQDKLVAKNHASRQALDNARAARDGAKANLAAARAGLASARAGRGVLDAQRIEEEHILRELRTALDQAKRDLTFTVIRAPIDGVVGNRAVEVGQYLMPGTRIAAVVPIHDVYIDANFKETQLSRVSVGQEVNFTADAYPDHVFRGRVESISPASGAVFSLLPPENATGNFTKIVQRLPVRVRFATDQGGNRMLRPGMSVEVTIDTRNDSTSGALAAEAGSPALAAKD